MEKQKQQEQAQQQLEQQQQQQEQELVDQLRARISDVTPESIDHNFVLNYQTLRRYLHARDWDVTAAENQLRATIQWRRENNPHLQQCAYCQKELGFHAMRHVGFDLLDRPVFYSNFAQCQTQHNTTEDSLHHVIYLVENAKWVMKPHVHQFVWVIDFTGMKLTSCNPRLGLAVERVMSAHYPERLGAVVCINHGVLFHGFWKAVKGFLDHKTKKKLHMERSEHKMEEVMSSLFPDELKHWLYEEVRLNKTHPYPVAQKEFWRPSGKSHDPRGCPSYVQEYIDSLSDATDPPDTNSYRPHPNILSYIFDRKSIP